MPKATCTEVSCILEVVATGNDHKDINRFLRVIDELRRSTIDGAKISGVVVDQDERPITVPDFAHNYACKCENKQPKGILRYFGLTLFVDGEPTTDIFGRYWITRNESQLDVCGLAPPLTGNQPLEKITGGENFEQVVIESE